MAIEQFRPRGFNFLPPVVKNLLIINGLFFLATITFDSVYHIDLDRYLGLHYFESELFRPWQYITYMFMHGGIDHIIFNMFALWMFGYALENYWGGKKFLFYYLVTGVGAAFIQTLVNWYEISAIKDAALIYQGAPSPDAFVGFIRDNFKGAYNPQGLQEFISAWSLTPNNPDFIQKSYSVLNEFISGKMDVPTIGASGSVFGILLAFGMMFPNQLLYIYFLFPIKAKWVVIFYGAMELYFGVTNTQSNVAHFAHLGGMLFGIILILYWKKNNTHHNYYN
ncbi:MAG: rhomboid family intramembrane serine protease [Bacteroidetes bacterium]|nr:rhomboid family intramembrane serine protease [Bacteroidota bacterium]